MTMQRILVFASIALSLAMSAWAQSSKIKSLSRAPSVSIGSSSATSSFRSRSAGQGSYGNLYSAPRGGGALSSSIGKLSARQSSAGRTTASPFGASAAPGRFGKTTKNISRSAGRSQSLGGGKTVGPMTPGRLPVLSGASASVVAPDSTDRDTLSLATEDPSNDAILPVLAEYSGQVYAELFAPKNTSDNQDTNKEIKTLAPQRGTTRRYRQLMREGEEAFKKEDYSKAVQAFELAAAISSRSSESQLSLMHVHFATARGGYGITSHYLQRVLKQIPELTLIPVHPRNFYGNAGMYVQDVIRLEEYAKSKPHDVNAQLLLAYLKWREDQPNLAAAALRQAWKNCKKNDAMQNAIHTLWDGMVYSGKLSGTLEEASESIETEAIPDLDINPMVPPGGVK